MKKNDAEKYYPQIIEEFACRNFKGGDRVKVLFEGKWYYGIVVDKYNKKSGGPPYVMIQTDEKVDEVDDEEAYLKGHGIEIVVDSPRVLFEHEEFPGDEIYTKTCIREMTPQEKKEYDDSPF